MTWKDEILLREIERFETRDSAGPLPEEPICAFGFTASFNAEAYTRLEMECAEAHRAVKRQREKMAVQLAGWNRAEAKARGWERAFQMATWSAGGFLVWAIIGWALWWLK